MTDGSGWKPVSDVSSVYTFICIGEKMEFKWGRGFQQATPAGMD